MREFRVQDAEELREFQGLFEDVSFLQPIFEAIADGDRGNSRSEEAFQVVERVPTVPTCIK